MQGSRYLDLLRTQHRRRHWQVSAKMLLTCLAFMSMGGSAAYWWGVQRELTAHIPIAIAYTAILVLAPPSLTAFLIPWSPAGMLLQKIQFRTWGMAAVLGMSLFLLYYSVEIQYAWWAAQPTVAHTGLVMQQVVIGIIGFILIPALLWTPVSSEELVEQARQSHLVRRYELQTQADIAILRTTLLRTQEQALIGFAQLTVDGREELAGAMRGLLRGIDSTLSEIGASVQTVNETLQPFASLDDNDDIQGYLAYLSTSLMERRLSPPASDAGEGG